MLLKGGTCSYRTAKSGRLNPNDSSMENASASAYAIRVTDSGGQSAIPDSTTGAIRGNNDRSGFASFDIHP